MTEIRKTYDLCGHKYIPTTRENTSRFRRVMGVDGVTGIKLVSGDGREHSIELCSVCVRYLAMSLGDIKHKQFWRRRYERESGRADW